MCISWYWKYKLVLVAPDTSLYFQLEAMSTQPIGPALRHSFGVAISGCLMGITVAYSAGALDDMADDIYLKKPSTKQEMMFSVSFTMYNEHCTLNIVHCTFTRLIYQYQYIFINLVNLSITELTRSVSVSSSFGSISVRIDIRKICSSHRKETCVNDFRFILFLRVSLFDIRIRFLLNS